VYGCVCACLHPNVQFRSRCPGPARSRSGHGPIAQAEAEAFPLASARAEAEAEAEHQHGEDDEGEGEAEAEAGAEAEAEAEADAEADATPEAAIPQYEEGDLNTMHHRGQRVAPRILWMRPQRELPTEVSPTLVHTDQPGPHRHVTYFTPRIISIHMQMLCTRIYINI
jgi:hypothetical protein